MKRVWLCLVSIGCASGVPAEQPDPAALDDSCLHACLNVQSVPLCPPQLLTGSVRAAGDVAAAAEELIGQPVRARGRLGRAEGSWTQIDCPRNTCCSEQLDASLAVGELALEGRYQIPGNHAATLRCVSRAGMMIQSLAGSIAAPFSFELWDRRTRGEPQRHALQRAYCCNLDAHGQDVIVEGTLAPASRPFGPNRLVDPFVCATSKPN
jgi:hypothetical protein